MTYILSATTGNGDLTADNRIYIFVILYIVHLIDSPRAIEEILE